MYLKKLILIRPQSNIPAGKVTIRLRWVITGNLSDIIDVTTTNIIDGKVIYKIFKLKLEFFFIEKKFEKPSLNNVTKNIKTTKNTTGIDHSRKTLKYHF